jgi:CubicO group peptidase (beta-lactamase class C family)
MSSTRRHLVKRRDFIGLSGTFAVGSRLPAAQWLDRNQEREQDRVAQEDPRFREIGALIEAKMREYRIPGVAFGIVKNGATAVRGFGLTNLDNPQPVTPDTVFPIMSITKTMVAVAMLRLVEQGKLALEAPVREYLAGFKVRDREATETVTLRHLLTHTPGWEGQVAGVDNGVSHHAVLIAAMAENPQLAKPGELWSYNNLGFGVASRVLEVVTGSGIHEALRSLVFTPLSLDRAFTQTGTAMTYPFAAPHVEANDRTVVSRPFQLPADTGAGGGAMSLSSLMTYARFHLGAQTSGDPVLKPASLELLLTPHIVNRPCME